MAGPLDRELAAALVGCPRYDLADIQQCRALDQLLNPPYDTGLSPEVRFSDEVLQRPDGSQFRVRVVQPRRCDPAAAVLVNIHGGGFCLGAAEYDDATNAELAKRTAAVIVSPQYRLAPEHPYPAALEDCIHTLTWLAGPECSIPHDPARLAVMGNSAGGGLAAACALWLRDHTQIQLAAQILLEPELDHRLTTPSMRAGQETPIWFLRNAEWSWNYYLAGQQPDHYASPSLATHLANLPPTYIWVNQVDPLRDEGLAYATALGEAGVAVEVHQWPGTCHGFIGFKHLGVTKSALSELVRVISAYV